LLKHSQIKTSGCVIGNPYIYIYIKILWVSVHFIDIGWNDLLT